VERVALTDILCAEAAEWQATMHAAPPTLAGDLADLLGRASEPIVTAMTAAMRTFLHLRGDQDAAVRAALDRAAHAWNRISLTRLPAPPVPDFDAPVTLAEANGRYAAARAEKVRAIMRLRAGELLIKREAAYAAEALRVQWIQAAQENFIAAHGAELLGAAGIQADHGTMHALAMIVWEHFACAFVPIWPGRQLMHPGAEALTEAYGVLIKRRAPDAPQLEKTAWYAGSRMPKLEVPPGLEGVVPAIVAELTAAIGKEGDPRMRLLLERLACIMPEWIASGGSERN
jgi:hypothetical protein